MARKLYFSLSIKGVKKIRTPNKVSRKCLAVVVGDDDKKEYRAKVDKCDNSGTYYIVSFTERSLVLKGRAYVFTYKKDQFGKRMCIIRNAIEANCHPGNLSLYSTVRVGLLISGKLIRNNGRLYFDLDKVVAFHPEGFWIADVVIDEDSPLFNED